MAGKGNASYLGSLVEENDSTGMQKVNFGSGDVPAFQGTLVVRGGILLEDNTLIRTAADLIPPNSDVDGGTF